ncbi:Histone acetyltransferase type B catalytic subunit [Linum perenne]
MAQKQQPTADPASNDPKKRRRVGFAKADSGVEANDCISIYLISSKDEMGAPNGDHITPIDLNSFFGEDGKIYGYSRLKITVWISSISFRSYADISYENKSDSGKGITDLNSALQNIFGETLVDSKEEFLQTFSSDDNYIRSIVSSGEVLQHPVTNKHDGDSIHLGKVTSDLEVVRMVMGNQDAGDLYSRVVPLVLLLVDGSNPIDVTDQGWELYVLIQKKDQENSQSRLLGFSAVYRFYHYPDSNRLRLGQILVLPSYQRQGYGRYLIETIYNVAISEDVYDFTVEEPLDTFQHVRTCIDVQRLLGFESIQETISSAVSYVKHGKLSKKAQVPRFLPPPSVAEDVRKVMKINKKQLTQCWEILLYLKLEPVEKYMEDFVMIILNRVKEEILGEDSGSGGKQVIEVPSEFNPDMSFVMLKAKDGKQNAVEMDEDQSNQQREQLKQLVDERLNEIKAVADKVRQLA